MRFAVIENGQVVNVVLADAPLSENWIQSNEAQIGWLYEAGSFVLLPAPAAADPVPQVVSRFQARAALHVAGKLAEVEALVARADPLAQIAWADAQEFRRDSPTINALAAQVGMTDADLDDLFRAAAKIVA